MKMYAGYVFSSLVWNNSLKTELRNCAAAIAPELTAETFAQLDEIIQTPIPTDIAGCEALLGSLQTQLNLTEKEAAALLLALGTSYTPAQLNEAMIETILARLAPAAAVEIIVWLSVLQLLNRMSSYHDLLKK